MQYSALLLKLMSALRTGDADLSLTARNADLLSAGRTFVNMKILALLDAELPLRKPAAYILCRCEIAPVLLTALRVVFRKHPEIADAKDHKRKHIEYPPARKQIQDQTGHRDAQHKS